MHDSHWLLRNWKLHIKTLIVAKVRLIEDSVVRFEWIRLVKVLLKVGPTWSKIRLGLSNFMLSVMWESSNLL